MCAGGGRALSQPDPLSGVYSGMFFIFRSVTGTGGCSLHVVIFIKAFPPHHLYALVDILIYILFRNITPVVKVVFKRLNFRNVYLSTFNFIIIIKLRSLDSYSNVRFKAV